MLGAAAAPPAAPPRAAVARRAAPRAVTTAAAPLPRRRAALALSLAPARLRTLRARSAPSVTAAAADGDNASSSSASTAPLKWSLATVVENKPASADGSLRTLTLSVQDEARARAWRVGAHGGMCAACVCGGTRAATRTTAGKKGFACVLSHAGAR
jgi:hypothetical protein